MTAPRRTNGGRLPAALGALLLLASLHAGPAGAQDAQQLFDRGKAALDQRDYLAAVEHLFAYLEVDRALLANHPDFRQSVLENLAWAEGQIRAALHAKRQLDGAGQVVGIQVETGGKFDAPGAAPKRVTKPFRPPQGPPPPGRRLGERPPLPPAGSLQAMRRVSISPLLAGQPGLSDRSGPAPTEPPGAAPEPDAPGQRCAALEREHAELEEAHRLLELRFERLRRAYREQGGR